jgi:hypothetical protein
MRFALREPLGEVVMAVAAPTVESVGQYLEALKGRPVRVLDVAPLAEPIGAENGAGTALRIEYEVGGRRIRAILERMRPAVGVPEDMARSAEVLRHDQRAASRLPRHVRALDFGALDRAGALVSLGRAQEFFVLKDCADGRPYECDLADLVATRCAPGSSRCTASPVPTRRSTRAGCVLSSASREGSWRSPTP